MTKWVYSFGDGLNEGRADMRNLLGGKGANLAEMAANGLPVPPGFTITTEVCSAFYENGRKYPADLQAQVAEAAEAGRAVDGPALWRCGCAAAGLGPVGRAGVHAGHDGYGAEPGPE
ncbi:hypothetical protein AA16373_2638 [Komagataeibacter swingsii DSM 16373]|nr:hypothetical protein AA16373_2638 [Komagataeibacter swingsii DSM 16373]